PQPGAAAGDGTWRMAFAIPAELGRPGTRLWLHDGGVHLVELVIPAAHAAAPVANPERDADAGPEPQVVAGARLAVERVTAPAPAPDPGSDPRAKKLVEAWAEASTLREKLADREGELANALKERL